MLGWRFPVSKTPHVDPRCAPPRHPLSLRSPGHARAAARPPPPGAVLPHADPRYSLKIEPEDHFINWQQDPQSNYLARLVFPKTTREFKVEVDLVAEMAVYNPFDFFLEDPPRTFPFDTIRCCSTNSSRFMRAAAHAAVRGLHRQPARELHPAARPSRSRTIDFLVGLNQRLSEDIKYLIRMEPGVQTPEETLESRSGSCRDSAWLLCQLFRHCGLAARFVSGYLIQLKADQEALDGPSGATGGFHRSARLVRSLLPGAGWIGFDATCGLLAGEGHIPLAGTPDPQSAAPDHRRAERGEVGFHFEMTVTRIHESPRVTKPYTPEQWAAIEALGKKIDEDIAAGDVRLTMGGEPTFVSIDDPDGEEWNFTALGPHKRLLSGELIKRLRAIRPRRPAALRAGQMVSGRAAAALGAGLLLAPDGQPIWTDDALIADESKHYGHGTPRRAHSRTS